MSPQAVLNSPAAQAGMGLAPMGLAGAIKVYHGSPHVFDKFDMSKIGTGEGAQAYGHGLYFAESPSVAGTYKNALSKSEIRGADGELLYSPPAKVSPEVTPEQRAANALQYAFDAQSSAPYQLAGNVVRRTDDADAAKEAWNVLADWQAKGAKPQPAGAVYETELRWPDPAREATDPLGPQHFMNYGEPLERQSQFVQDLLAQSGYAPKSESLGSFGGSPVLSAPMWGGNQSTAAELARRGIPGIRYLDAGSRATSGGEILGIFPQGNQFVAKVKVANRGGAGFAAPTDQFTTSMPFPTQEAAMQWARDKVNAGTSNYVLFDDALANILTRNGIPLP
jgi:hypothetical protein